MKRLYIVVGFCLVAATSFAQKVDSIYFHLYTDSLKKGFYNYINVDGKLADGGWIPLSANEILLSSTAGTFKGNDLFIDSSYHGEAITVKAALKGNPHIWKEVTIYIRKRPFTEPLKTADEILNNMHSRKNRSRQQLI